MYSKNRGFGTNTDLDAAMKRAATEDVVNLEAAMKRINDEQSKVPNKIPRLDPNDVTSEDEDAGYPFMNDVKPEDTDAGICSTIEGTSWVSYRAEYMQRPQPVVHFETTENIVDPEFADISSTMIAFIKNRWFSELNSKGKYQLNDTTQIEDRILKLDPAGFLASFVFAITKRKYQQYTMFNSLSALGVLPSSSENLLQVRIPGATLAPFLLLEDGLLRCDVRGSGKGHFDSLNYYPPSEFTCAAYANDRDLAHQLKHHQLSTMFNTRIEKHALLVDCEGKAIPPKIPAHTTYKLIYGIAILDKARVVPAKEKRPATLYPSMSLVFAKLILDTSSR